MKKRSTSGQDPFREPRAVGARQGTPEGMDFRGQGRTAAGLSSQTGTPPVIRGACVVWTWESERAPLIGGVNPGGTAEVIAFVPEHQILGAGAFFMPSPAKKERAT